MNALDSISGPDTRRGSALMIVLWGLALLAATVVGLVVYFDTSLDEERARNAAFRTRLLAESGLAIALNPQVEPHDPVLRQEMGPDARFEASIRSEGGRLNLNTLAASTDRALFLDLFAAWGLTLQESSALADAIQDWVDTDETRRLDGAERDAYERLGFTGMPRNRPFTSIEEARAVIGMDLLAERKPDWADYFTLHSSGQVDVNEASAELLRIVTGAGELEIERIIERRLGPDQEEGTEDDFVFESLDQVRSMLGMAEDAFERIAGRLSVDDPARRIESTGQVGAYRKKIVVIARREGGTLLSWQEPPIEKP